MTILTMRSPSFISCISLNPTSKKAFHSSFLGKSSYLLLCHADPQPIHRSKPPTYMMSRQRLKDNVDGEIYVDSSCINCDICRWFAPSVFHKSSGKSAVYQQPTSTEQELNALQASVACPTGSIRTENPTILSRQALRSFPTPALDDDGNVVPDVYYCGFSSQKTFAARSWILRSPQATVMIDCPRYSSVLAEQIGPVDYILLTHQDDVHGHERWAKTLNAKRIIHIDECNRNQKTNECEIKLKEGDFPYTLADGIEVMHVPGHTKGSIVMIDNNTKSLFSGDHLFGSEEGEVTASTTYCFYSWEIQMDSIDMLTSFDFEHIWPGHGRPLHFKSKKEANLSILNALRRMRSPM